MAKPYRKLVLNITSLLAGLFVLALPGLLSAAPLPNFTAHYQLRHGNTLVGTRVLTFTREGQNYTLSSVITSSGIAALLSPDPIRETSHGIISGGQPLTSQYTRNDSNKPSRNMRLIVDHARQQVLSKLPRPATYGYKPVLRDLLNEMLAFMYAREGKTASEYGVAYDSRPKYFKLEMLGPEKIMTSAGEYQAVRYKRTRAGKQDRHAFIWTAPTLHNLPVKIESHKKGTVNTMTLTRVVGL